MFPFLTFSPRACYNAGNGEEGEQSLHPMRAAREGQARGWKPPGAREEIRSGAAALNAE